MKMLALILALLIATPAPAEAVNYCYFDFNNNVQQGWDTGYGTCCGTNSTHYNANTNTCSGSTYAAYQYGYDAPSPTFGEWLVACLSILFCCWLASVLRADEQEPTEEYTVAEATPPVVPQIKMRPRIVTYDPNPAGKPQARVIEVVAQAAPAPTPAPPAPAPQPKRTVSPSTTDYIKQRTEHLIDNWGIEPDRAARAAQEEFESLSNDKQQREQRAREGLGPKQ
jgi:hypothetical protein